MKKITGLIFIISLAFMTWQTRAQRIVQDLDRGVVAIHSEATKAFVSWRLFATEPSNTGFNLYRSAAGATPVKLNTAVLTAGTNFTDLTANFTVANEYFVKPVLNGTEREASRSFIMPANTPVRSYMSIPLNQNLVGYTARYVRVGDLDGDGDYDFVVVRSGPDETKTMMLEAYKQDGTYLWTLDCGPNSLDQYNNEPGSSTLDVGHGDNIMVYDINEDGKAEVIVRTANGVKFGNGAVLQHSDDVQQFISVLNGLTGAEISRTPYNNPYIAEGPMNGHFGIAYLDGIHPSVVWEAKNRTGSENFNEMTTTWDWKNGTLVQRWQFFLDQYPAHHQQTGHQIRIIDLDGDGKDEICPQGFVIDDDGTLLYTLADQDIFHGDRFFIGDLDPDRPGMESYGIQQGYSVSGIMWYYCDAKTGKLLLNQKNPANVDLGRGNVGDFDPRYSGYEFHTFVDHLYNVSGAPTSVVNMPASYPNFKIWWDGDLLTENLDNKKMTKWNYLADREDRIKIDGSNTFPNGHNVGPNTPSFAGDILGDWREEVVYESTDLKSLLIYTTPIPTTERIYTLSQNPGYLASMSVRGYYQGNMTDFYLGNGMQEPPVSPIQKADKYWTGTSNANWDTTSSNWESAQEGVYKDGDIVMFDFRGSNAAPVNLNTDFAPAKVWAMNPKGKDYVFSGTGKLTGAMTFVKSQAGLVTFNGNYDYSGETVISEGGLNINGSLTSKVYIKPKGAVGGTGILKGGVVLEKGFNVEGGRFNPGNGIAENQIGSLVIEGDLDVPGNNNFSFDIVPGSTKVNDSLIVKGQLKFSNKNKIIVKFKDDVIKGGIYTLIRSTGSLTAVKEDFSIDGLDGIPSEIIIENNQINLKIFQLRDPAQITWKGTVDNNWNSAKENFDLNGTAVAFIPKDTVMFDDTALLKTVDLSVIATTSGVNFNATNDYIISGSGIIAGSGDLIKSNSNKVTIESNSNTFTGKTIINGGILAVSSLNNGGESSSLGASEKTAGKLVINNSTLQIDHNSTTNRVLTINGNSTIFTSSPDQYAIFSGDIAGSGSLIKEGPGALYLLYNNSYSGETILKDGTIYLRGELGNNNGLGAMGKLTIESGSLIMEDRRVHDDPYWNIVVPAGKTASFTTDGRCTLNGSLTGAGILNLTMPFIRTEFRGDWSAFTGTLNVNGDFRLGNTFGYGNSTINLNGVIYSLAKARIAIGELTGNATSSLYDADWEIGAKNTNSVFAGSILGMSLTKVGTGSLTLTGNNTFVGVTDVNKGKLIVNNTAGSGAGTGLLTVNDGGVLSGTGILSNPIVIASGGTLAPGDPELGKLTVNNSVTMNEGSIYESDIYRESATSDILSTGSNSLVLGGKLVMKNRNTSEFALGDSFKIFEGTNITGNFKEIVPKRPGKFLFWDTSKLKSEGVISVTNLLEIIKKWAEVRFYPNPVRDICTIELTDEFKGSVVDLYDSLGRKIKTYLSTETTGESITVNLKGRFPGIYIIKCTKDGETFSQKIIKI